MTTTTLTPDRDKEVKKTVFASSVGTLFEWYDFYIYGLAAVLVFNALFFPNLDPAMAFIVSMTTYAVGLFARPLGAVIFGIIGDRYGRKHMLVVTMLLMGLATFLIGLLPTTAQIGVLAPIALILLRVVQGIGLGGEWGGAAVMVQEHTPPAKRGLYTSFVQLGNPLGMLMASGIFAFLGAVLSKEEFLDWGWRVPFLLSAVLVMIGLAIRLKVRETPVFQEMETKKKTSPTPLRDLFFKHPVALLKGVGLKLTETTWFFVVANFTVAYVSSKFAITKQELLQVLIVANAINVGLCVLVGWLSDIVGRKNIFYAMSVFTLLYSFPYFYLINSGDVMTTAIAMVIGLGLGSVAMYSVLATYLPAIFEPQVRGTGSSLSFQLGAALGGGVTTILGAWLVKVYDTNYILAGILIVYSLITLWAAHTSREDLS